MREADSRGTTLKWRVDWLCKALPATIEVGGFSPTGSRCNEALRFHTNESTFVFYHTFHPAGSSSQSSKEVSLWSCAVSSPGSWPALLPLPWREVAPDKRGVSTAADLAERSEPITTTYRSSTPSSSTSRLSWTSAVTTEFSAVWWLHEGDEWNKGGTAGSVSPSGSSSAKLVFM